MGAQREKPLPLRSRGVFPLLVHTRSMSGSAVTIVKKQANIIKRSGLDGET